MNIDDNSNDIPLTFHDNIVDAQIFSKKLLNYIIFIFIALFIFFLILSIIIHNSFLKVLCVINILLIILLLIFCLLFAPIKGIFEFNLESKKIEYSIKYYFRKKLIDTFIIDDIEKFQLIKNFDCLLSYDLFIINYEGKKNKLFRGFASKFENGYENQSVNLMEKNLNEKLQKNSYNNF
jgi:hypothetical protein